MRVLPCYVILHAKCCAAIFVFGRLPCKDFVQPFVGVRQSLCLHVVAQCKCYENEVFILNLMSLRYDSVKLHLLRTNKLSCF
jgi:hypothetical protein